VSVTEWHLLSPHSMATTTSHRLPFHVTTWSKHVGLYLVLRVQKNLPFFTQRLDPPQDYQIINIMFNPLIQNVTHHSQSVPWHYVVSSHLFIAMEDELTLPVQQLMEQLKQMQSSFADAHNQQGEEIKALQDEVEAIHSRSSTPILTLADTLLPLELRSQPRVGTTLFSSNGSNNTPPATTPNPLNYSERSWRLPNISKFSGKQNQFPLWKAFLLNKFIGNWDWHPTEILQLTYAQSRITGEPALTLNRLNNNFTTLDSLITGWDKQYGDPNEKTNADLKLQELQQGKRPGWVLHQISNIGK
jgi:hypothetical protein